MKIKRKSILYKIAKFGGLCEDWFDSNSICSFHKYLLLGILQGIFGLVFGILVLTIMGLPFYYGILYLIDPVNTFPLTQNVGLWVAVGMALDIVLITIIVVFKYRDKICIKVEYE